MEGSDLDMLLQGEVNLDEHPVWAQLKFLQGKSEIIQSLEETKKNVEKEVSDSEASYSVPLAELGKTMVLQSTSTGDPINSYQRTDWTVNKRMYKHKLYVK